MTVKSLKHCSVRIFRGGISNLNRVKNHRGGFDLIALGILHGIHAVNQSDGGFVFLNSLQNLIVALDEDGVEFQIEFVCQRFEYSGVDILFQHGHTGAVKVE